MRAGGVSGGGRCAYLLGRIASHTDSRASGRAASAQLADEPALNGTGRRNVHDALYEKGIARLRGVAALVDGSRSDERQKEDAHLRRWSLPEKELTITTVPFLDFPSSI